MTRRCTYCSNEGHNSRTCPTGPRGGGVVKLFGVNLIEGPTPMKKSSSMGNLSLSRSYSSDHLRDAHGYLSDDPNHASCSSNPCPAPERKKGKPWTEEEHRLFLVGLQKLGKGDWRGIARNYVMSRTPTQVASHAQKYIMRHTNTARRRRRPSLFDIVPDKVTKEPETVQEEQVLPSSTETGECDNASSLPSTDLSLSNHAEPMEVTSTEAVTETAGTRDLTPAVPAFYVAIPYPQLWAHNAIQMGEYWNGKPTHHNHQILKPTPVLGKEAVNLDEVVGMSRLNLTQTGNGQAVPLQLSSLGLLRSPSSQSAFHVSTPAPTANTPQLNQASTSMIQAV